MKIICEIIKYEVLIKIKFVYSTLILFQNENDNLKLATVMFVNTAFNIKDSFVENSEKYLKLSIEKLNFKNDTEQQRHYLNNNSNTKHENSQNNLNNEQCIFPTYIILGMQFIHCITIFSYY